MDNGCLIGFPMVDIKVTLYDGAFHEVDSSAIAFEIASRAAFREACDKAGLKLLEPIMDVEVVTPGDFVGTIIGDLNSRRGQVKTRKCVPTQRLFGRTFRSPICSATSIRCARLHRAAPRTRCSLHITQKCRVRSLTRFGRSSPDRFEELIFLAGRSAGMK